MKNSSIFFGILGIACLCIGMFAPQIMNVAWTTILTFVSFAPLIWSAVGRIKEIPFFRRENNKWFFLCVLITIVSTFLLTNKDQHLVQIGLMVLGYYLFLSGSALFIYLTVHEKNRRYRELSQSILRHVNEYLPKNNTGKYEIWDKEYDYIDLVRHIEAETDFAIKLVLSYYAGLAPLSVAEQIIDAT